MTYACQITGTGGARLTAGTTITGSAQRDVVVSNGICRVRYDAIAGHRGAHSFDRMVNGAYVDAFNSTYGDRLLWISEFTADPDRTIILTANDDMVEWVVVWDAHTVNKQAYWYDGSIIYAQSSAVGKTIATCKLWKALCMRRGEDGYFVGVRTNPRTDAQRYPTDNNELAQFGDRSMGPGTGDSKVLFFSTGNATRHPHTTADGNGSYHTWPGIDDPSGFANQPAGYPAEQATGPWWCGDMPNGIAVCRYVILEHRLEVGALQYALGQYGSLVVVGINEELEDDGLPKRYQLFLGAFPYTINADTSLEPTTTAQNEIRNRVPAEWPPGESSNFFGTSLGTTAAAIRNVMLSTVRGLTPDVAAERKFADYREDGGPVRRYCDANPAQAPRRFSIRDTGELAPPSTTNTDVEWVETQFEVVVAYPYDHSWGSLAALSLDDVIESDAKQIDEAIGTNGYHTLDTTTGGDALVTTLSTFREDGDACRFLVLRLSVKYWRSFQ